MSQWREEILGDGQVRLICADMREALRSLPDNSVDSVATDPPYHLTSIVKRLGNTSETDSTKTSERVRNRVDGYARLAGTGFMGKVWDGGDIAFQVDTWREVFRVLKPGGHLAAFGGTRTFARMSVAIEDAGFEIRDTLMWCYSTGFPKSHDVSKAIDKVAGVEREVIGTKLGLPGYADTQTTGRMLPGQASGNGKGYLDVTAPATESAKQWEGWGTALKPAVEPVVLARKPLSEKTVAANVLRWRTGAINIDECRVGPRDRTEYGLKDSKRTRGAVYGNPSETADFDSSKGRWPANLVHDGSDEVVAMFPVSKSCNSPSGARCAGSILGGSRTQGAIYPGENGSAARFFYQAKASRADRDGSSHPTVKPISLMRWLTRLITPPGGLVLDPFAGSGTTGAAAVLEGFRAILIEREAEYIGDIIKRFSQLTDVTEPDLFVDRPTPTPPKQESML